MFSFRTEKKSFALKNIHVNMNLRGRASFGPTAFPCAHALTYWPCLARLLSTRLLKKSFSFVHPFGQFITSATSEHKC